MDDLTRLIEFIRDEKLESALNLLNEIPHLAQEQSAETGQFHGVSALHWAAHRNAVSLCERLLELGADVNASSGNWWLTPLAWGADAGSADAVELLLQHGAEVDQDAIVGTTALHAVAMGGSSQGKRNPEAYQRTAEILIRHGACLAGRPEYHRTPLDDALEYENQTIIALLKSCDAPQSE